MMEDQLARVPPVAVTSAMRWILSKVSEGGKYQVTRVDGRRMSPAEREAWIEALRTVDVWLDQEG